VFFNSYCGFDNEEFNRGKKRKGRGENDNESYEDIEKDKRCTSIKEAVKFAKSNNLLGVICDATLLVSTNINIYKYHEGFTRNYIIELCFNYLIR
jgi:CDK inhibitor PHO81